MKLWLSKNSEVPIKAQLAAQVRVAIAAGDLKPGDRLPSTRELSRRFDIHPNTVSAAYRELGKSGEVLKRSGSGVFVAESSGNIDVLDDLIAILLKNAESHGYAKQDVIARLHSHWQDENGSGRFALIEPDPDLAEIIVYEIREATGSSVSVIDAKEIPAAVEMGIRLIAMYDEKPKLAEIIPDGCGCTFLTANSAALAMAGQARPSPDTIVAILSAWNDFLAFARVLLIAAKVDADSIVCVSTKRRGWRLKIQAASVIICDVVSAARLEGDGRVRVFPLISENSLAALSACTL